MPIQNAVDIMWLQPGVTVVWTWNCGRSDAMADLDPAVPPPLYFWFIPLGPGGNHATLCVSPGQTYCRETEAGRRWEFAWQIANRDARALPLKINIWTPLGANPCAFTS